MAEETKKETTETVTEEEKKEKKDEISTEEEKKEEKTFTQEQVTAIASKEKKQGRSAFLKELGYESEDDLQKAIKIVKALEGANKTDEEKASEEKTRLQKEKIEADRKVATAEAKVEALSAGVKPENLEDVMALAMAKKTDDSDLKTILGEIKTKYPAMFAGIKSEDDDKGGKGKKGTGGSVPNNDTKGDKSKSMGARLAAQRSTKRESSFWGK